MQEATRLQGVNVLHVVVLKQTTLTRDATDRTRLRAISLSEQGAETPPMVGSTRQTVGLDISSLISVFWILFYALVFYWFYSHLRRMEKTLQEIKKALESKTAA